MRRVPHLLALAVLAFGGLVACGDAEPPEAGTGTRQARRGTVTGVEWVSLPPSQAEAFGLEASSFWAPAEGEVRAALERVGLHLKGRGADDDRAPGIAARLPAYRCQTVGFVRAGRRFVHFNFFVREEDGAEDGFDWTREALVVDDGGDAYWQVDYEPSTATFHDLWINGEA